MINMCKLSVNVNKIATLRNARGENRPNVLEMALMIEDLGAHGITVHPRPDERHIRKTDVLELKKHIRTELNVEGYPSDDFIAFMHEIRPGQITLVPDPPHVLTSDAGFTLKDDYDFVVDAITKLRTTGSRISLFMDPHDFIHRDVDVIKACGTDRIELYTKAYADHAGSPEMLKLYRDFALRVHALGVEINAGHDLSLDNLGVLLSAIPVIEEVSIGHALTCEALLFGMPTVIARYLSIIENARSRD